MARFHSRTVWQSAAAACAWFLAAPAAHADNVLALGDAKLDRPTLIALGVQLLISGDDNHNANVSVRYRVAGTSTWRSGPPLLRVRPESVVGRTVPEQFAGSVFDLAPNTTYEVELHAVDPDGTDQTVSVMGTTRAVPSDPTMPRAKSVSDASSFKSALDAAQAGDVITLANGTYSGPFSIHASGTREQPIVIRGASEDGVTLDGGGCSDCNVLEVYGSFVHVENLTLAHANRALRFQGQNTESNVVRWVHVSDTTLGFGSNPNQADFYICDNILEGRLSWPSVYTDDNGAHANDDGIHVEGYGHVVCHNRVSGYGDALKTEQDGARAVDFYGNEVLFSYDNGIELDGSEGNARCFRNRFTNTYATISVQPIFGGPAYILRNVVVNVANEQMKFHARSGTPVEEPSGVLVYHNTFVSPTNALADHTSDASHHFVIENNLFVSASASDGRTMDWTSPIDDGTFDYDGFYPDGIFDYDFGAGYQKVTSFAMARAMQPGFEPHGLILAPPIFESGLTAPSSYKTTLMPADVSLAASSNAIDKGVTLPGINDSYSGSAPDLGAYERGCAAPLYGVRPKGQDESNEPSGCAASIATGTGGASGAGTGGGAAVGSGGAGHAASGGAPSRATAGSGGSSAGNAGNAASGIAGAAGGGAPTSSHAKSKSGCGCHIADRGERSGSLPFAMIVVAFVWRRGRSRRLRSERRITAAGD